jgi:periplasmic protein TonB
MMNHAIDAPRESGLGGWPFWVSVLTHIVGLGAVSAVAATPAATTPPPVPIELVRLERPVPPPEVPKPKLVKAAVTKPILRQPMTAAAPAAAEPPSLLDEPPRTDKPAALPDPVAPDRRFLAAAAAPSTSISSNGVPAGAGALFATGDLPVVAGRGTSGGRGVDGTGQTIASTGSAVGLTDFARPLGGYQTTPRYPDSARRQGVEGITTLRFIVLPNGHVDQIAVARSAGHVDLDRAAMDAVRTWRFEPARRGKEAVAVWVTLPVRFELHND